MRLPALQHQCLHPSQLLLVSKEESHRSDLERPTYYEVVVQW